MPESRSTVIAGLLAVLGYLVAAWKLTALSWDGSWYLFRTLQDREPFIPHCRYGTYPLLWLLVQASRFIPDPRALGIAYGALLALIPLGALALSWHYLRGDRLVPLRLWPALGILLSPLPGQLCLMSEATLVAQLFWPLMIILLVRPAGRIPLVWLAVISAMLLASHPSAALIFVAAAALCGWQRRWTGAGAFILLAVTETLLTSFAASDYERSQMTIAQVLAQAELSLLGYPAYLLGAVYLGGLALLARKPWVCAAVAVIALWGGLHWGGSPASWRGLLDYRRFVLPATLPLTAMALWHHRHPVRMNPLALSVAAGVFCAVLAVQAFSWGSLLDRFQVELGQRAGAERVILAKELPFTSMTALDHWSTCPLSILLQGRTPRTMLVERPADLSPSAVQVNPWDRILLQDRWFSLARFQGAAGSDSGGSAR